MWTVLFFCSGFLLGRLLTRLISRQLKRPKGWSDFDLPKVDTPSEAATFVLNDNLVGRSVVLGSGGCGGLQTTQTPSDDGQVSEMKNPFTGATQKFFYEAPVFKTGDSLSIAGTFKRRSFWQWFTRKPRELLTFTVVDNVTSEN